MNAKDEAKNQISDLVERFTEQLPSYKKSDYNEALTRKDFIDPFFKALGWDMNNSRGYAEAYREVIHEDKVKIGSATKAPDYSFRLPGGKRLFFVEAKKPSVYIKDEVLPAYQVRRYAWSAKLPVSILTDFEEFAVYDCKKKPNITDKASDSRIKYITYKDYLPQFDFIWDSFSKERVLKGGFDKYVQSDSNKKGTSTVDKEFLVSLDEWRKELAQNIALRNIHLNEDDINYTVQQTLDRLIFLRIAEDRGVEEYGRLKSFLQGDEYYQNLFQYFKEADSKYNSGLFNFKKDTLSSGLALDNKVLKNILNQLYYPVSPYEFSVLSVEILGSAYEQFLGKQIRLTASHKAVIEEKPEVRKAGGVYYTPEYIVEYIVKNTIGKLAEGKTPEEIAKLKIVDPACGSGSFLIGAYQYLLNYHQVYYQAKYLELDNIATSNEYNTMDRKDAQRDRNKLPLTPDKNLTTAVKKQILLNNIFGVDIDAQAVEVTKLSLMLKCMEGETKSSIALQLQFGERILPTLDDNIKCGNSLIDVDFYDGLLDFEPGIEKKVKPFSWQKAFPTVFKQGGFDGVIGNPPYLGGREWKEENGNAYNYFISKYQVAEYQFDIYALFWEAGIKLLKPDGTIGLITPNTWLNNQSNKKLRTYILNNTAISKIVDYSKTKVFGQVTVLPIITILKNTTVRKKETEICEPIGSDLACINNVNQKIWEDGDLNIININLSEKDLLLRSKIEENTVFLEKLALVKRGIQLYETGKGIPKQKASDAKNKIFESSEKIDETYIKFLEGKDIHQYYYTWKNRWIKYGENLAARRDPILFEGARFAVRRIVGNTLIAAYFTGRIGISQLLHIVKPFDESSTKFLLGIINSKLLAYYFRKKYNRQDKTFPEIRIYELASLPIKIIDFKNKPGKLIHDEIVHFVETMLQLQKEKQQTTLPDKLNQLETRIQYTDDKINKLVYELYGLNEEEVGIVKRIK